MNVKENIEVLSLAIISYEDFIREDQQALLLLKKALYETGIVAIRGIPGYQQKVQKFIEAYRQFSKLPEAVKEAYAPNHALGETFIGYEKGKENFQREDGRWVVDDLKVSYYANIPDQSTNKWPKEMDLKTPFQDLGALMSHMGADVMKKIGLIGPHNGISLDGVPSMGRMLYYKGTNSISENPYWNGPHFDHGLFTALIPSVYFMEGKNVPEPMEAGLYVKTNSEGEYKKVIANDPDLLLFQVGEFAQLLSNDAIRATEHQVRKAPGYIERFTLAVFFDAPMDSVIHSTSVLTKDSRYGGKALEPCSYRKWYEGAFDRYVIKS